MSITVFGIKNCDSVKKAKKWFEQNAIDYQFHDFRVEGIDAEWLKQIENQVGWEVLLNKRGTTFRQLDDAVKQSIDKDAALALMLENPTLIKRPVVTHTGQPLVGFNPDVFSQAFES